MSHLNRLALGIAMVLAGCAGTPVTSTVAVAGGATAAAATVLPPVVLHQMAPNVTFQDGDGTSHTLNEFKGKFVVLAFFAHWCGVCQKEMPVLQQFATDYKDKNAVVVGIESTGAPPDIVKSFADLITPGMTLYHDTSLAAPKTFLVERFPTLYIISPDFSVQEAVLGAASADYLKARYQLYVTQAASPQP